MSKNQNKINLFSFILYKQNKKEYHLFSWNNYKLNKHWRYYYEQK